MGDVVSRFGSLNQVRELFTNNLVESIIDGLMALVVLVVMFLYSPMLAFVVIGVTLLYGLSRALLYRPLQNRNEAAIIAQAKEQSNFMETVRGMQSIKLFGHQTQRLNLWQNRYADTVNETYRLGQWQVSYQTINQLLFGIENVVVVYLAAVFVMEGDLTVGMLFAFMAYKGQFTERMAGLIDRLVEVKMVRLHLDCLADIALTDKEDEEAAAYHREIEGTLKLDKVSFRYAMNNPLLFDGLELTVNKGMMMSWNYFCGCILVSFILLRVLDAGLTAYGISNYDCIYELNPAIEDPSSFWSVIASPIPLAISAVGFLSIFILFGSRYMIRDLRGDGSIKLKIVQFLLDLPFIFIVASGVAVVNNVIVIFLGGWDSIIAFSLLFNYSEILPVVFLFVMFAMSYEFFVKPRVKDYVSLKLYEDWNDEGSNRKS